MAAMNGLDIHDDDEIEEEVGSNTKGDSEGAFPAAKHCHLSVTVLCYL